MADSANIGGEVDERDGMVVDWSDLTEEDRIVVAELVTQEQQQQQPREEPEAAVELSDDDESRAAAAAVLDVLFNDTSSESDFEGFASAEVEASMMPTVELGLIHPRMKWVKIMKRRGTSHGRVRFGH